jgi:hypothetical protein
MLGGESVVEVAAQSRDPIPYALETDWPVEAGGFEPLHFGIRSAGECVDDPKLGGSASVRVRGLAGWAYWIRTGETVLQLSDWNCVTTAREVGAIWAVETLRAAAT